MNDPYSVLGVSQTASDEDVKKAYRELVRKYHPDNYHDNPLADLAQEKMKEINEAYDKITKGRDSTASGQSGGYTGSTGGSGSADGARVRAAINAGNLTLAEQILASFPARNAEWCFLMGSVCYRKGWLDEALTYYQSAVQMEPSNAEYRQALSFMNRSGQAYRPFGTGTMMGRDSCDVCDICTALMCMNMCCRCG